MVFFNKISVGFLILVTVSPCFSSEDAIAPEASKVAEMQKPSGKSRIRMYGQNASSSRIYPGLNCIEPTWSAKGIRVSGGLSQDFLSFVGASSNLEIGMPKTELSKKVSSKDVSFGKAYFQEHEIPAEQVTSVVQSIAIPGVYETYHCGAQFNFKPMSGSDYEVAFDLDRGACTIRLLDLKVAENGETIATPVPVQAAASCPPTATKK